MQTSNRVHRNGGKKSVVPQAPRKSKSASDTVTLVFETPDGSEFERVDLPAILYATIEAVCRKRGHSVMQFIEEAVAAFAAGKGGAR